MSDRDALMEWYLKYGERGIEFRSLGDVDKRFFVLYSHDWIDDTITTDKANYMLKITPKGLEFIKNGT